MRDEIAKAAKANNRSMNAEIISRLEESFSTPSETEKERIRSMASDIVQELYEQGIIEFGHRYDDAPDHY